MEGNCVAKPSEIESKRQPLVLLNVGGQSFRKAKSTLTRYPDCLLSKMIEEFPNLVAQKEELYIDRDPVTFPWILQIHRSTQFCIALILKQLHA